MNSAGKLGATMAATGAGPASSASTSSTADRTRLAYCVQTLKQTPQPMQRSGSTCALPVGDADRLGRALAHALVADAAALADGRDQRFLGDRVT